MLQGEKGQLPGPLMSFIKGKGAEPRELSVLERNFAKSQQCKQTRLHGIGVPSGSLLTPGFDFLMAMRSKAGC